MSRKLLIVMFLALIVTISSCQNQNSPNTTNPEESTQNDDNNNLNRLSWLNKSGSDGLNTPYTIYTLNDNSYYAISNRDIMLINTDGTVVWKKQFENLNLISVSSDTIVFTHYKENYYYIQSLNNDGEIVFEYGPYAIIDYNKEHNFFKVYDTSDDSFHFLKPDSSGKNDFLALTQYVKVLGDSILGRDKVALDVIYIVNYNLAGEELWRIGPFTESNLYGFDCFTTSQGEIIYSMRKNDYQYIVKLDSSLTRVWESNALEVGSLKDFEVYNDELYYIATNDSKYDLVKLTENNNLVYEKEFLHPIKFDTFGSYGISIIEVLEEQKSCVLDECTTVYMHLMLKEYDNNGDVIFSKDYLSTNKLDLFEENADKKFVVSQDFNYDQQINYYVEGELSYSEGAFKQLTVFGTNEDGLILFTYVDRISPQELCTKVGLLDNSGNMTLDNELIAYEKVSGTEYLIYYIENEEVKELRVTL